MLTFLLLHWITWTALVSAAVFNFGENLWALVSPPPTLKISSATTSIVEPLAPDGMPDYLQAILAREPRGIPVEKNAAAALWELIPSQQSSDNTTDHSQAHLSAADQLPARERLVSPPPPPAGMEAEEAEQVLQACTRGVWHAADHPWLAGWLDDNSAALDKLAAGARREGWCPPRCLPLGRPPTDRFGSPPLLMSLEIPVEGSLRWFSSALLARSMLRLGEGDITGAWDDIDSLLRYGDKIADTPGPLVCRMVAMALFSSAAHAAGIVILNGNLDDELLAEIQRALHSATAWAPLAESVDAFERLSALDGITFMFANPSKPMSFFSKGPLHILAIDPNVLLIDANRYLDAMVAAAKEPTREARRRASQAVGEELKDRGSVPQGRRHRFRPWHEVVSEEVSRKTLGMFLPSLASSLDNEDRAHAALVLVGIAAAVERYRLATGEAPKGLADLVPTFLHAIPGDPLTAASIGYRIEHGHWTLWCGAGPVEDGGDELVLRGPGGRPSADPQVPESDPPAQSPQAPSSP